MRLGRSLLVFIMSTTCGCASNVPDRVFIATAPAFDPVEFWTGHGESWGVIENLEGNPTSIIRTITDGTPDGSGGLDMIQQVIRGNGNSVRHWHIRRLAQGEFEATASDLVGTARGTPAGRTLHWTWTLAAKPGNPLFDVEMNQWMYLSDHHTLLVRTVVKKLGIRLAEISEQFERRCD